MNEDFIAGEDVTHLFARPTRPAGLVVSVRFPGDLAEALVSKAEAEHMTLSQYVRHLVERNAGQATVWVRLEPGQTISAESSR